MKNRPLTEEAVKQLLGVDNFQEISDDQIRVFVSEIPRMDKDVVLNAVEQFPAYNEFVKELADQFFNLAENAAEDNSESVRRVQDAYKHTIELMSVLAQKDDFSFEERKWFAEKAVEIADKMAGFDVENKNFLTGVLKTGLKIAVGLAVSCLSILGLAFLHSKDDDDDD